MSQNHKLEAKKMVSILRGRKEMMKEGMEMRELEIKSPRSKIQSLKITTSI